MRTILNGQHRYNVKKKYFLKISMLIQNKQFLICMLLRNGQKVHEEGWSLFFENKIQFLALPPIF